MTTKSSKNWAQKEKRELFCKAVNSLLMTDYYAHKDTNNVKSTDDQRNVIRVAQETVDKAFELYPDLPEEGQQETLTYPSK